MAGFQKNEAHPARVTDSWRLSRWVERERERERERGQERDAERWKLCERHTHWREGYYMQTARERSVKRWESEIQTQTSVERRLPERSVIGGRMDLTQRRCWQSSFAGPSDAAAGSRGPSLFDHTFRRMQRAISHSSTARSQLLENNHTTSALAWPCVCLRIMD